MRLGGLKRLRQRLEPHMGRIVDAHIGPDQRFLLRCGVSDLISTYDKYGVRIGLVSSTISLLADYALGNKMVLECVRMCPGRVAGLYALNPLYEESVVEAEVYVEEHGFRGN